MALATTTSNVKTATGNRYVVEFGGQAIGLAQSVRMADSYALEAASGIGDIHVKEYVPTRADHTLSVSSMTLMGATMRNLGIAPINGDDALKGLVFDIAVYSRDTGQKVRSYISCSYDSGTSDISAHRIIMQDAQFKCLNVTGTDL